MNAITLITQRELMGRGDDVLDTDWVVGITPEQEATIVEHGVGLAAKTTEIELRLAADSLARIVAFYREYIGQPDPGLYDCAGFAGYAAGYIDELDEIPLAVCNWHHPFLRYPLVRPNALSAGTLYSIRDRSGYYTPHHVIGINAPSKSIGVFGTFGRLIIARNAALLRYYHATNFAHIGRAQPESATG